LTVTKGISVSEGHRTFRRQRSARVNRGGFTLVEVIVAMTITVMVIGTVSFCLSRIGHTRNIGKLRLDAYTRADAAMNMIRREIASVIRSDDLFHTRLMIRDGKSGDFQHDTILVFNTRLRPVRGLDAFTGEGIEYESQFRIEHDEWGPVLWHRRAVFPDAYPEAGGVTFPAVEGIVSLSIEALDWENRRWYEDWDSDINGLPLAVRITVIASGHRPGENPLDAPMATLRTVVAIDRVPPPRNIYDQIEEELDEQEAAESGEAGGIGGATGDLGGGAGPGGRPGTGGTGARPGGGRPGGGGTGGGVGGGGGGGGAPGAGPGSPRPRPGGGGGGGTGTGSGARPPAGPGTGSN